MTQRTDEQIAVIFLPSCDLWHILISSCLSKRFCLLKLKHSEQQQGWEEINPMMTCHGQSMWFWLRSALGKWAVCGLRVQHGTFFFFYFSLARQILSSFFPRRCEYSFGLGGLGLHPFLLFLFYFVFQVQREVNLDLKLTCDVVALWRLLFLNPVVFSLFSFLLVYPPLIDCNKYISK